MQVVVTTDVVGVKLIDEYLRLFFTSSKVKKNIYSYIKVILISFSIILISYSLIQRMKKYTWEVKVSGLQNFLKLLTVPGLFGVSTQT